MMIAPLALAVLAFLAPAASAAAGEAALRDGAYEVTHRLELPHIEPRGGEVARICLSDAGAAKGLPVLSPNNPLAGRPVTKLRRDGRELSFEIACPGGNAAKAHALFDLGDGRFEGRISMNMGGKNMTMTEAQRGVRTGDCGPAAAR